MYRIKESQLVRESNSSISIDSVQRVRANPTTHSFTSLYSCLKAAVFGTHVSKHSVDLWIAYSAPIMIRSNGFVPVSSKRELKCDANEPHCGKLRGWEDKRNQRAVRTPSDA